MHATVILKPLKSNAMQINKYNELVFNIKFVSKLFMRTYCYKYNINITKEHTRQKII